MEAAMFKLHVRRVEVCFEGCLSQTWATRTGEISLLPSFHTHSLFPICWFLMELSMPFTHYFNPGLYLLLPPLGLIIFLLRDRVIFLFPRKVYVYLFCYRLVRFGVFGVFWEIHLLYTPYVIRRGKRPFSYHNVLSHWKLIETWDFVLFCQKQV